MIAQTQDVRLTDGRWLRIPGPTPVPPVVMQAMTEPMIPHRSPEMVGILTGIREKMQQVYRTGGDVMVWASSGSSGWEAALENSCSPGDTVVATVCGEFGKRYADVAERFGLDVHRIEVEWGTAITADQVQSAIDDAGDVRAVLVTHSETSTGVANPLKEIAAVARKADALVLVDAVSSAAAIPLETDDWKLDWVISGSQKAWMCPPGLMLAAVSERALNAAADVSTPRSYFDVERMAPAFRSGLMPMTPAISLMRGLNVALDMMMQEGVEQMWARQVNLGMQLRERLRELDLELLADPDYASGSLTTVCAPEGMTAKEFQERIRQDSGIEVAVGQGPVAEKIIRIGHMGWTHAPEMEATVESIARVVQAT